MRLVLIRHAPTASTRRAAFSLDESLDEAGTRAAGRLAPSLPAHCKHCVSSPALRARQTAQAAGWVPVVDPDLAECDFGSWAGRTLEEVQAEDPEGLASWFTDPEAVPHAGESLAQLLTRVQGFLGRVRGSDGTTAAFTHAGVIRAAVVAALRAPIESFWRIDIAPLSTTELHATADGWRVTGVNRSQDGSLEVGR
jgi:broad specificity phosphatase PhoE